MESQDENSISKISSKDNYYRFDNYGNVLADSIEDLLYDKYTTKYTAIVDFSEGSKENVDKAYEDYHFKWDIYVKRLNKMLKVIEEIKSSADTIEKNEEEIYETLKDILKESYEYTNIGDLKEDDYKKLEERKKQQEEQEKGEEEEQQEKEEEEEEKTEEEEQQGKKERKIPKKRRKRRRIIWLRRKRIRRTIKR